MGGVGPWVKPLGEAVWVVLWDKAVGEEFDVLCPGLRWGGVPYRVASEEVGEEGKDMVVLFLVSVFWFSCASCQPSHSMGSVRVMGSLSLMWISETTPFLSRQRAAPAPPA